MALIIDPDLLEDSAADDGSQEVYINTATKTIKLVVVGNLSTDGVTLKALYSFLKEEWRLDPNSKNLAAFPFPMVPITDESFEIVDGWDFFNDTARYLIRTGGWTVRNTSGNVTQKWAGLIGLGNIESDDQLYFQQITGNAGTNVQLTGQVNQAVQILRDDDGDGNFAEGSDFDRRSAFKLFVREQAQIYDDANLVDIGVTSMDSIAYRFPIGTSTDLKITHADSVVSSSSPYTGIHVKYFSGSYRREVDTVGQIRNFGIIVDAGTCSGPDGFSSAGTSIFSSSLGIISSSLYTTGTLTIHTGSNKGTYNISGTPGPFGLNITTTFPVTAHSQSYTIQRATPLTVTAEQIYEKVQWDLRQNFNINAQTGSVVGTHVTGSTADLLLRFVGDTLECGTLNPANPLTGSANGGVIIEGFAAGDTNRLTFRDNGGTNRSYPFVAVLTLQFGANLVADASAKYWVYFTTLPGGSNDFGESGALIVDDNSGADMAGNVSGQSSIVKTFNYDANVQGGRTPGTDADITVVAIGLQTGQYVRATATIARSTSNSVSLVAPLERNYQNP
jgi:hypothetical protein